MPKEGIVTQFKSGRKKISQSGLQVSLVIGFIFFFLTIVPLIYLSYQWFRINQTAVTKDELRRVSGISKDDAGQSLKAEYPARVLYKGPAKEIRVTRWATSTLSTPLTLTLLFDEGLVLSDTRYLPGFVGKKLVFSATTETVQTVPFHLLNARTIEDRGLLTQTLRIEAQNFTPTLTLPIEVEGAKRSIQHQILNSTVNEKSPLILGLSALISVIAFTFNFVQKSLEKQEKQRREELEKQEKQRREEQEEQQRRKVEAAKQFQKVREELIKANASAARHEFNKLQEEKLQDFINSSDIAHTEKLIQIATGHYDGPDLEELAGSVIWVEETLGALLALANSLVTVKERRSFDYAVHLFLSLNQQQITDKKRQELLDVKRNWEERLQSGRVAPRKPNRLKPQPSLMDSKISQLIKNYSPFEHEFAENDLNFLFGKNGGFWSDHPRYYQLANNDIPEIIFGPPGCGKTALGHALVEIDDPTGSQSRILPLYVSGRPDISEIQNQIARTLLKFVCDFPFKLGQLSNLEQNSLARYLCISLGYDIVRPLIEGAKRQTPLGAKSTEQLKLWRTENIVQLDNFGNVLETYKMASWLEISDWLKLTEVSLSAFDFDYALVALDFNDLELNHAHEILALMRLWARYKLILKLFIPQAIADKVKYLDNLNFLPITWTDSQIDALAKWRFDMVNLQLSQTRVEIETIFDDGIYAQFVQNARCNPRYLVRLWRYLFEDHLNNSPEREAFSEENLSRAARKLNESDRL